MVLKHLPAGNALQRSRHGEAAEWSVDTHLLALIGDILQIGNWQRAGDRHGTKPKPIRRPGEHGRAVRGGRTIGAGRGMTVDEMKQRLGWR